ncbi:CGNR zinc finger domain-containing protein [Kitasatospora aureofaciens]|uniref:CGNR zinc finger domain-containing protein n=1 Tax=Kitasatospora aureofaciens TaxID=1894 RepID=UPI0037CA903E
MGGQWPLSGQLRSAESGGRPSTCRGPCAAVDSLSGPQREQLRARTAPRCVRYSVKSHGRQGYCKPPCGNRARVARHRRRQRTAAGGGTLSPDLPVGFRLRG